MHYQCFALVESSDKLQSPGTACLLLSMHLPPPMPSPFESSQRCQQGLACRSLTSSAPLDCMCRMQDPSAASAQPAKGQQGPTTGADTTGTAEPLYTVPQAVATLAEPAVPPVQFYPSNTEQAQQEHEAGMTAHPGQPGQGFGSSQKPKVHASKGNCLARALQAISNGCGRCCGRTPMHGESPKVAIHVNFCEALRGLRLWYKPCPVET